MLRPVISDLNHKSRQFFLGGKCLYKWLLAYKILRLFALIYRPHLMYKTNITNKSTLAKLLAGNLTAYDQALDLNTRKNCTIITSEKHNLTNENLDLGIDDTNKSLLLISDDRDTSPESEYNPKLDNIYCDIYIYRLYLCRYSLDTELYGLD